MSTDRLNRGMLSSRPSKAVSPHVVMGRNISVIYHSHINNSGISCIILSMVVVIVSSVIVVKKYQASAKTMEPDFEHEG